MFRVDDRRLAILLLYIPALPVLGQSATPVNQSAMFVRPIPAYTAEFKTVNVRTLANGTTITTETTETRARDSQGRSLFTHTSHRMGTEFTSGNIDNPVDNTRIIWNSREKKVSVIRLPAEDQRHGCWTSAGSLRLTIHYGGDTWPPSTIATGSAQGSALLSSGLGETSKIEQTHEDLGTAMIQGLEAKGTRFTSVIPAGRVGNDSPITTTREIWRAPGFPYPLREISDDPRSGKRTRETVNLTIGEPDLSMFQPPEGYQVVNEEMVPCQQ